MLLRTILAENRAPFPGDGEEEGEQGEEVEEEWKPECLFRGEVGAWDVSGV